MVGLLETGEGEGPRDEFAGVGVGGGRRLMRVEGAAVVFWRSEFVSGACKRTAFKETGCCRGSRGVIEWLKVQSAEADLLDGKGVFRRLLRAMGSNDARCSSEGPGVCIEDKGSTSSESSVMPLKVDALRLE